MKKAWWDRFWPLGLVGLMVAGWGLIVAGWGLFGLVILGIALAVKWLNG